VSDGAIGENGHIRGAAPMSMMPPSSRSSSVRIDGLLASGLVKHELLDFQAWRTHCDVLSRFAPSPIWTRLVNAAHAVGSFASWPSAGRFCDSTSNKRWSEVDGWQFPPPGDVRGGRLPVMVATMRWVDAPRMWLPLMPVYARG
jgi:hypothetical protein